MQLRIKFMSLQFHQLNNVPLFEFLEKQQNDEVAVICEKEKVSSLRRFYINNFLMVLAVICSICMMFYVQFTVDAMQEKIDLVQLEIDDHQDEIKMLNVEWYYLTRPDRLRYLSAQYLQDKQNIAFRQVQDYERLQQFAGNNLEKRRVAMQESQINVQ